MKTISEQRIRDCLEILAKRGEEKPIVKGRLNKLQFQLVLLLDEIEEFSRVVYCKNAVACWLDSNVLKMLSGSKYYCAGWKKLDKDQYYNAPSPAACAALGRGSANGWKEWKGKSGKSMEELRKFVRN